ncbi:uncharacterized protein [Linepithema humile]|uniref:uncharacterized protein isoform X2 n=1 Tax=Linepithema humile TaxID=83485 RepID=UPI00351F6C87
MEKAREMLKKLVDERLTSYETEGELGRGKRKRRASIIYTDDEDSDSDVPEHDSDSVQHKKIGKFGRSKKIIQDIQTPPPFFFQHKTGSISPDQSNRNRKSHHKTDSMNPNKNDKNKKIIVTVAHENTKTALSLREKIKSLQTERQGFLQKLKEENKNTLKNQKNATVSQFNIYVKSPLQQKNVTYEGKANSMRDEKENVIDECDAESNLEISSESQNSFKNSSSRDTEVRPSYSTHLSPSCLYRINPKSSNSVHRRQLFSSQKISQDTNDSESLSFDINKSIREIKSLCKTTLVRVEELNSKVDVTIMNQTRLNRSVLPAEKRIMRPPDLPALPLYTEDGLKAMERFLEDDSNLFITWLYFPLIKLKEKQLLKL